MFRVIINFTIFHVATFSMCARCKLISKFLSKVWVGVSDSCLFILMSIISPIHRDGQTRQTPVEIVIIWTFIPRFLPFIPQFISHLFDILPVNTHAFHNGFPWRLICSQCVLQFSLAATNRQSHCQFYSSTNWLRNPQPFVLYQLVSSCVSRKSFFEIWLLLV